MTIKATTMGRPGKSAAHQKQNDALALRAQGLSYEEVAKKVGYSNGSSAYNGVMAALDKQAKESAPRVIKMELRRLDDMMQQLYKARDCTTVEKIASMLKIMERRARYLGLDKMGPSMIFEGDVNVYAPHTQLLQALTQQAQQAPAIDTTGQSMNEEFALPSFTTTEPVVPHPTQVYDRVLITGGPRVGKSTLSAEMLKLQPTAKLLHTDDAIDMGWSEGSQEVCNWFDLKGPWVIEGVAGPRALRKWLNSHPIGKPCDIVYWSNKQRAPRTPGQEAMAKGCTTVWTEIIGQLNMRGVRIEDFPT